MRKIYRIIKQADSGLERDARYKVQELRSVGGILDYWDNVVFFLERDARVYYNILILKDGVSI